MSYPVKFSVGDQVLNACFELQFLASVCVHFSLIAADGRLVPDKLIWWMSLSSLIFCFGSGGRVGQLPVLACRQYQKGPKLENWNFLL